MIKDNAVFAFEGDSVTDAGRAKEGLESDHPLGTGYAMMAAEELQRRFPEKNLECHNRGFSGDRISNQFPRWRVDCLNLKPDYISICLGVNDSLGKITHQNGESPKEFIFLYRSLLQWTREILPEVRFIICQPYAFIPEAGHESLTQEVIDELREIGENLRSIAVEFDAIYVPFFDVLEEKVQENGLAHYIKDFVHPNETGHALLAQIWLDTVLKSL